MELPNKMFKRPMYAHLMATVSRLQLPQEDDHASLRVEIARRMLGRMPVIMRHPWNNNQVVYVEGEPDDWREFLEQKMAEGKVEDVLRAATVEGRAN